MTPEFLTYALSTPQLPGMTLNETTIAQGWIKAHANDYDTVDFQVRIGTQQDPGPNFAPAIRQQAMIASQKRVDMVAKRGTTVALVELKIRANLGAMGQLLGYYTLWTAENPGLHRVKLICIAQTALVDAVELFHARGLTLELFPDVLIAQLPPG